MPIADLNGVRIHFTDTGGDGPAIVFSHGLLMSGLMFEDQIAHFKTTYRCITFDHRGQGQSGVTEDGYDIETLAEDAAALLRFLDVGPCHFVGLSMGGFIGMRLAAQHPELLKTLTLLGTSAEPEPASNIPKYRMLNLIARWLGLGVVVAQVMPIMFGKTFLSDPDRAAQKALWKKRIASADRTGTTRAVGGVIARQGCVDLLANITLPVGIGVGGEDTATPPEKSKHIHAQIAGSELTLIDQAGHSSAIEQPLQVIALIERTLQRGS